MNPRTVFATAGHVDHGKTSLVRALTGTDTDRLPDEKRRGISIELGFAELPGESISFIDVPGHRKLVPAMIAGVGGVAGLLLVVAADDGVMPQTREHLWVASLLGIRDVVVALSKADRVDAETLGLARAEVETALETVGLQARTFVETSTVTLAGLDALRQSLIDLGRSLAGRAPAGAARLAVDRVFSVKGAGTVVTGTLTKGRLQVGDDVVLVGERGVRPASCRGLEVHGRSVEEVAAPTRLAVNLARTALTDVARGDVLTTNPELPLTTRLAISLRALPDSESALADGRPVIVHLGTTRVPARILRLDAGFAELALERAVACEAGMALVLRGFSAARDHGQVLGGGTIVDAIAPALPRRGAEATRARRLEVLRAASLADVDGALTGLLALAEPFALECRTVEKRFGWSSGTAEGALQAWCRAPNHRVVRLGQGTHFAPKSAVTRGIERLEQRLSRYHTDHPHEAGLSLETCRHDLSRELGPELCLHVLEQALATGRVLGPRPEVVCLPSHMAEQAPQASGNAARLLAALEQLGLEGAPEAALYRSLGLTDAEGRSALSELRLGQRALRLGTLWFAESAVEALRTRVRTYLAERGRLSVPDFKDLAGVSRKQAIPLLEQLDREGTTRRHGDDRVLGTRPRT